MFFVCWFLFFNSVWEFLSVNRQINSPESKQQNAVELHLNIRHPDTYSHLSNKTEKQKQNNSNSLPSCAQSCWKNWHPAKYTRGNNWSEAFIKLSINYFCCTNNIVAKELFLKGEIVTLVSPLWHMLFPFLCCLSGLFMFIFSILL